MTELGKLTERIDGMKEAGKSTNHLQIAGLLMVLALAALGAFGFSSRFSSLEGKIDKLEERLGSRLDKLDDREAAMRDRVTKLEPRPVK